MGTMFDYVKLMKHLPDGQYNKSVLSFGRRLTIGHKALLVTFNKRTQILTIRGSLPYFMQGHNVYFSRNDMRNALQIISDRLEVDIFDATVAIMEYGVVVDMPFHINDFIDAHLFTKGYYEDIFYNRGKNYHRNNEKFTLKFYLVEPNIIKKCCPAIKKALKQAVFATHPNLLRYEMHGNPCKILSVNHDEKILAKHLLTDEFEQKCRKSLLDKYTGIKKRVQLVLKNKKSRFSIISILLILLANVYPRYEEAVMRMIDKFDALTQTKYKRKDNLRKKIKSLETTKCEYSIESLILSEFERQPIQSVG